ncbi:hypothetical protein [Clostridium sp. JNZ J1-5]|nr:hypothetical protein [Clostridium sp.]
MISGGENKERVKTFDTIWFMWITLIFFAPVGIYLMWKHKRYGVFIRVILSIIFLFVYFLLVGLSQEISR